MSAVAAIVLGLLKAGDHIVAGNQLYGRTMRLVNQELPRLGFATDLVEQRMSAAVEEAIRPNTRCCWSKSFESVAAHPGYRRAGRVARSRGVLLVVDNTFPTPLAFRPLSLGAHIVFHSITKMLAGHSDVTLGAVCGSRELTTPIRDAIVTWGSNGSPFDCGSPSAA